MDLIIEAGGSKTTFFFQNEGNLVKISKEGFNPSIHAFSHLKLLLRDLSSYHFTSVFYYGAGVTSPENIDNVRKIIVDSFRPNRFEVASDLMGAARACLGNNEGVINILGTGSATAWYDGSNLDQRVISGGYLIGDHGSGFELGRKIASLWLTGMLTPDLALDLEHFCKANALEFRKRVYTSAYPVKEVAHLTHWILRHKDEPLVQALVQEHFETFARFHLERYTDKERTKVAFCGGLAHFFKDQIEQIIKPWIFNAPIFVQEAGPGLCDFHFINKSMT